MALPPRGRVALVTALTLLATGLLAAPAPASERLAPDGLAAPAIVTLGLAPAAYTLGRPEVLVTSTATTLVAWRRYGQTPNALSLVRRTSAATSFTTATVPRGALTEVGEPSLTQDRAKGRILLTASGQTGAAGGLGLYVWVSTDDGRTWAAPRKVWNSFASGQIAVDGVGGFWAISDLTGVSVVHVPASLALQTSPGDDIVLSDRLGSRAAIDLASTGSGSGSQLLVGWGSADNVAWVHVSAARGSSRDVAVMTGLAGDGAVQLAGDPKGAVVAAIRRVTTPTGTTRRLFVSHLVAGVGSSQVFPARAISALGEDVVSLSVAPLLTAQGAPTGTFVLAWVDSDGRLRTATSASATPSNPRWSAPRTVVAFPSGVYSNPGAVGASGRWIAAHGFGVSLRELELAVRTP